MAGALAVIGGTLLGVGVAESQTHQSSLWSEGWFDAGFGVTLLGAFALVWALILYLAHRHAGGQQGSSWPVPDAGGAPPATPEATQRQPNVTTVVTPAEELRTKRGLRRLRPLEVGLPLSELPGGIYGFMPPWHVTDLEHASLNAEPGGTCVLEIHKTQDGETQLIGYVSQETATRASHAGTIWLYPEPWEEANPPGARAARAPGLSCFRGRWISCSSAAWRPPTRRRMRRMHPTLNTRRRDGGCGSRERPVQQHWAPSSPLW